MQNADAKLSDQRNRVKNAYAPLPITAAVRVRLDNPAKEFSGKSLIQRDSMERLFKKQHIIT